jgi:hypothetical protein
MKARIRMLIAAVPFEPFVIRMADGREYRIDSPEFVVSADLHIPQLIIEDAHGREHFLSVLLMTSIESATVAEVV